MIRIWDGESLREYDHSTIEGAVAAYLDDTESDGDAVSECFDVVVQARGKQWMRYAISAQVVRQVTVGGGVRVEDPTAGSGADDE